MGGNIDIEPDHVDSYSTEAKANMRSRSQRRDGLLRMIVKNDNHILSMEQYVIEQAEDAKRLKELAGAD